ESEKLRACASWSCQTVRQTIETTSRRRSRPGCRIRYGREPSGVDLAGREAASCLAYPKMLPGLDSACSPSVGSARGSSRHNLVMDKRLPTVSSASGWISLVAGEEVPMAVSIRVRKWTLRELHRLPEDSNKYELVRGELFVTPPPTDEHETIAAKLTMILG